MKMFAHTVEVLRLHLTENKKNPLLIIYFLKKFLITHFVYFFFMIYVLSLTQVTLLNSLVTVTSDCAEVKDVSAL